MNLTIPASPTLPLYNNPSSLNLAMTSCPDWTFYREWDSPSRQQLGYLFHHVQAGLHLSILTKGVTQPTLTARNRMICFSNHDEQCQGCLYWWEDDMVVSSSTTLLGNTWVSPASLEPGTDPDLLSSWERASTPSTTGWDPPLGTAILPTPGPRRTGLPSAVKIINSN